MAARRSGPIEWATDRRLGRVMADAAIELASFPPTRRLASRAARSLVPSMIRGGRTDEQGAAPDPERLAFVNAIVDTVERQAKVGLLPRHFLKIATRMLSDLPSAADGENPAGIASPWVLAVAPTRSCNLSCDGCYSNSAPGAGRSMSFELLDRLVTEARRAWGVKLVVLTGGEPFMYSSGSRGLLDLAVRHPDLLFLVFTNGTLIGPAVAKGLASLGNVAVALSLEGMEQATDRRRGPGTFRKVEQAIERLNASGALTGISMTATRENCQEIFSDEVLDDLFGRLKVSFGFVFQYIPEGRDPDPQLMPTPEQRLWMWKRSWDVVRERGIVLFDFWNHGNLLGGCLAAGRDRGYLYVDWDGNVMPCVFAPFSDCNIEEVFRRDGGLEEAWASPFLVSLRGWQETRAQAPGRFVTEGEYGGMMCSCPVRDHFNELAELVLESGASPVDATAGACMASQDYRKVMDEHGRGLARLIGGGPPAAGRG